MDLSEGDRPRAIISPDPQDLVLRPTRSPTRTPSPQETLQPHPEQTSDLLYISDGNLMRWDYVTGFTGILINGVAEFSTSATGKQIVVLRPKKIAANGVELFNLDLLDFESKQISTLIEDTPRLSNLTISSNGDWLAYTLNQPNSPIFVLRSDGAEKPVQLGRSYCQYATPCQDLAWSPDSRALLWSDSHGVWISQPEKTSSEIVHPGNVEVTDPEGKQSQIDVQLMSLTWSPSGRYVLAKVVPVASGVSWHAILDTFTGRLVEVPGSFEYAEAIASISWAPDGKLLVARPGTAELASPPYVQTWHILATHDSLLIADSVIDLPPQNLPISNLQPSPAGNSQCINWLSQLDPDMLLLGVTIPGEDIAPALFALEIEKGRLDRLFELPPGTSEVLWSPDGGGALILGSQGQIFFAYTGNGELYDLRLSLGTDAHSFRWLPPAPRS